LEPVEDLDEGNFQRVVAERISMARSGAPWRFFSVRIGILSFEMNRRSGWRLNIHERLASQNRGRSDECHES